MADAPQVRLMRMVMLRVLLTFVLLFSCGILHAEEVPPGSVITVATRAGVTVPVYAAWRDDAVATVVLFSGGGGGYGQIGSDGWPNGGNFLIRTGRHWASHPLNAVMVGRPTDGIDLSLGSNRTGAEHDADNKAIFREIKRISQSPLWVVGTSMGTISAAAAAIQDQESLVAGVVLTASVVAYKIGGALPKQHLEKIRVPVLILHHAQDACWSCQPREVQSLAPALVQAPVSKLVFVSGGEGASGDPCGPLHHHGFAGMQNQVVDMIAAWIRNPAR